jgi:hypothetical protein
VICFLLSFPISVLLGGWWVKLPPPFDLTAGEGGERRRIHRIAMTAASILEGRGGARAGAASTRHCTLSGGGRFVEMQPCPPPPPADMDIYHPPCRRNETSWGEGRGTENETRTTTTTTNSNKEGRRGGKKMKAAESHGGGGGGEIGNKQTNKQTNKQHQRPRCTGCSASSSSSPSR